MGSAVGTPVGCAVGGTVTEEVGMTVGSGEGAVGLGVGSEVGAEGTEVGVAVRNPDAATTCTPTVPVHVPLLKQPDVSQQKSLIITKLQI